MRETEKRTVESSFIVAMICNKCGRREDRPQEYNKFMELHLSGGYIGDDAYEHGHFCTAEICPECMAQIVSDFAHPPTDGWA